MGDKELLKIYRQTIHEPATQEVIHAISIVAQAGLVTTDSLKLPPDIHRNKQIHSHGGKSPDEDD
jgi:hypothetical protein